MSEIYDLTSEFNIEKHKQKFINYLEVIILPNGKVKYATPSHQEFLIKYCMDKYCFYDREEFYKSCPREYMCDYMTWLCKESRCIAMWNDFMIGNPNGLQLRTIRRLKKNELYKGDIKNVK